MTDGFRDWLRWLREGRRILAQLEELSAEHSGVIEEGGELIVEATASATSSWQAYGDYMAYTDASLTKAWLGAADLVDPGKVGSQAAVTTRAGITVDPRMVTDGSNFAASLNATLFKQLIAMNVHKIGVPLEQIPIPEMRMRTADDEVRRDHSDYDQEKKLIPEVGVSKEPGAPPALSPAVAPASGSSDTPAPASGVDVQKQALNGAQVTSLVDIITKVAAGELPRASALELITVAFPVTREQADAILGEVGKTFTPAPPVEAVPAQPPQTSS